MEQQPPVLTLKRRLKRIDPLQLGKMLGILYGILGLLFIPFFLLMSVMGRRLLQSNGWG